MFDYTLAPELQLKGDKQNVDLSTAQVKSQKFKVMPPDSGT
jgi:hypothetical protein